MTGVAFFDFDNTIIKGDIGPLFGHHMFALGKKHQSRTGRLQMYGRYIPHLAWIGAQTALYKARALRRSKLVRSAYRMLAGVKAEEYYSEMQAFVDAEIPQRIFPEVRKHIEDHLENGRRVVIITTGIEPLVEACLPYLPEGIEIIGCRLREKDGAFTGEVDGPLFGADKANIMDAYCRAAGISLADCYAYTDHFSDYHMLEIVGKGICIHPRQRLRELAEKNDWTILEPTC